MTSFQVGGLQPSTVIDFEVPKRYGLRQTIADTLGIGGIMRGLRTIPVLLDICRDMEELCPDALLLNYVNPMAMHCWAIAEATLDQDGRALPQGAGHGRRARGRHRAAAGGRLPRGRASTTSRSSCALERDGEDLYPALRQVDAAGAATASASRCSSASATS